MLLSLVQDRGGWSSTLWHGPAIIARTVACVCDVDVGQTKLLQLLLHCLQLASRNRRYADAEVQGSFAKAGSLANSPHQASRP